MASADSESILSQFRKFDTNGDGIITAGELGAVLKKINPDYFGDEEVELLLGEVDTNEDGRISYEEFVNWVTRDDEAKDMVAMLEFLDLHREKALGDIKWTDQVSVPTRYGKRSTVVAQTELRAMTLQQLLDFGELAREVLEKNIVADPNKNPEFNVGRIMMTNVNLYHLNDLIIMPLTEPYQCSFMELVGEDGPQPPDWFISHWWGTPFFDSLRMLKFHGKVRTLGTGVCYWMCTFANNQHNLTVLAEPDVLQTPFAKAIMLSKCKGTIALMTERTAMPFTRIWCVLEDFVSLVQAKEKPTHHLFDVASIIPDQAQDVFTGYYNERCAALVTDRGDGHFEDHHGDTEDGCWFPAEVSFKAVTVDVSKAEASNPSDKANIIRLIGDKQDIVNFEIQRKFAPAALYNWSCTDDVNTTKLSWLLTSGLLGSTEQTLLAIDENACLAGACEFVRCGDTADFEEVLDILLRARCNPDAKDRYGRTPLWNAIMWGNFGAVVKLLDAKCNVNFEYNGVSILDFASENGQPRVLEALKTHGYNVKTHDGPRKCRQINWCDLTPQEIEAAKIMGYTEEQWDEDEDGPFDHKYWDDLTSEQQEALSLLGYDANEWDENSDDYDEEEEEEVQ